MINSSQPKKVARCAGMATQRATFADSNATTGATVNATNSLKTLAGAVLERNTKRNTNATEAEKQRNFCNEKTPEKLRSVAADSPLETDGRHHCRTCQNLRNGFCKKQQFRPVDDIPRRCEDFTGYPDRIGQSASPVKPVQAPSTDPLLIEVWTPSGTPMTIRADNAEHAAWLRQMNPNPAPKPTMPDPDAGRISEAAHNAQGRYFKFLATWPDGRQCYLCQMPRQTIDEMRAQYPDAATIQPIENEEYPDD